MPASLRPATGIEQVRLKNDISCVVAGAGPALVLFHGSAGSWTHWIRNLDALGRDFRVFALDLPGFGASGDVPSDISLDRYVERIFEAVAALSSEPVRIVGFSFGGQIAAGVAARLGTQAARLSLIAPSGFEPPTGRVLELKKTPSLATAGAVAADDVREIHRHNLLALMLSQPSSVTDETIDLQIANIEGSRFKNTRRISYSGRILEFIAAASCPVQILYGGDDKTPFPSAQDRIDRIRAVCPSVQVDVIPGAGHWAQYEQPQRTSAALSAFLK